MSWHPSRIETRIRPASRTPRWDYGSSTPLPDGIYRPSHSQSSRSKDKEQAEELKKYKRDSDPRTHLTEAQLRAKLEEARRRAEVEQARRRAEVEASDTDADDRRAEVQYDLGSDQPVFYTFGELSRKGNRDSHPGYDGLSDNESAAVSGDEQETPRSVQQGTSVPSGKNHGAAAVHHVLESHYTGDGYENGHHSAELTAILSERAVVPQSMFLSLIHI